MDADSPVALLAEQLKGGLVVEFDLEDPGSDETGGPLRSVGDLPPLHGLIITLLDNGKTFSGRCRTPRRRRGVPSVT